MFSESIIVNLGVLTLFNLFFLNCALVSLEGGLTTTKDV